MDRARRWHRAAAAALTCALWALPSPAQRLAPRVELEDRIEVEVVGRNIYALDAERGGSVGTRERLHPGEEVLWTGASARVAAVKTDQRVLAARAGGGSWQEVRYRIGEAPPDEVLLGDRVALFTTSERALGYDGRTGNWVERSIGPNEWVMARGAGDSAAVVVTNRRALGVSPDSGGFFVADLRLHERFRSLTARSGVATVRTDQRLLVFQGTTGQWLDERLPIHE